MDMGLFIAGIGGFVLAVAIYILLARWVFKIDEITATLKSIDERLERMEAREAERTM